MRPVPASTYRLQLNYKFTLKDVLSHLDYFEALGVDYLYLSPLFKAKPKSLHGYDVVDFTKINEEIGTEEDLKNLSLALKKRSMGAILDFVPNHMCVYSEENKWWEDVLKKGQKSAFSRFFDIDWQSQKVLVPILGFPIEEVLKKGEIVLKDERLTYYNFSFPIKDKKSYSSLKKLLDEQNYTLADWHRGFIDLNYRRFFYINELAALRIEEPIVFQKVHEKLFDWIKNGWIQGLRIDHLDGLYDPKSYIEKLKKILGPNFYLIVEKILSYKESLRADWPLEGTTGYDFLAYSSSIFLKCENKKAILKVYQDFSKNRTSYEKTKKESKETVLKLAFQPEISRIVKKAQIGKTEALEQVKRLLINFPVYRSYISKGHASKEDLKLIKAVFKKAEPLNESIKNLFLEKKENAFLMSFQQLTPSVIAKGVEDTAFFRFFPLLSLNEVGVSFNHFDLGLQAFHEHNLQMQKSFPHTLLATSTHDTKYSEDFRSRISTLSEIPDLWKEKILYWHSLNKRFAIDPNDEYLLYQVLVGLWPLIRSLDQSWIDRIKKFMQKALREAKLKTNWITPNLEYEQSMDLFIVKLFSNKTFLKSMDHFVKTIAKSGFLNSLSLLVLKLTSPGIPDFYQGSEAWNFSLVDPDNRHVLDFNLLQNSLSEINKLNVGQAKKLIDTIDEGKIKLWVTSKGLAFRKKQRELFSKGTYIPVKISGQSANNAIAFLRKFQNKIVLVVAGRLFMEGNHYDKAFIALEQSYRFRDIFFGSIIEGNKFSLKELFQKAPFTVLEKV